MATIVKTEEEMQAAMEAAAETAEEEAAETAEEYPKRLTDGYYRVRATWEDYVGQIGAYRLLANAKAKADENPGYHVFTEDGKAIYPVEKATDSTDVEKDVTTPDDVGGEDTNESSGDSTEDITESDESADDGSEDNPGDSEENGEDEKPPSEMAGDKEPEPEEKEITGTESSPKPEQASDQASTTDSVPSYENNGNEFTIAYARLKTLMNIRTGNSLDSEILSTLKKGSIVEILQNCSNGWLRIRYTDSYAYVSNEDGQYADIGLWLYEVKRGDNLWKIANEQLGAGSRFKEIRELNGLTSNSVKTGMTLIMPQMDEA